MKKWTKPEVEVLDMECTEYGARYSDSYDEVRVDQNDRYWFSFSVGDSVKDLDGKVEKID